MRLIFIVILATTFLSSCGMPEAQRRQYLLDQNHESLMSVLNPDIYGVQVATHEFKTTDGSAQCVIAQETTHHTIAISCVRL